MHLCERKKSFIKIPAVIFISDVMNIGFLQIWHFDVTWWVGLELSFILMQNGGDLIRE